MDIGSGHKLAVHSDAITIKLFRSIAIDDIYGVHWFDGDGPQSVPEGEHASSTQDGRTGLRRGNSRIFPDRHKQTLYDEHFGDLRPSRPPARFPSDSDVQAEDRYDFILHELRTTTRLYQSHVRVKVARLGQFNNTTQDNEDVDTRAAICADLRNTRPAMSPPNNCMTLSGLIALFEPITRLLDKMSIILRLFLWLASQSHPITCPSICFSAAGHYLGDTLTDKLFRKHASKDDRIDRLKQDVSRWLSDADLYVDFADIRGRASVPLVTTDFIRTDLRSADIVVTRLDSSRGAQERYPSYSQKDPDTTGRVARLSGGDTAFSIPVCLLPSHGYLAPPPPESLETKDEVPVAFSVRATLPALFSETFLNFAATFSKTFQLVDIEEDEKQDSQAEAGDVVGEPKEAKEEEDKEATPNLSPTKSSSDPSSSPSPSPAKSHHPSFHHFRTKLSSSSPKLASALHLDGSHHNQHHHHHQILSHPLLHHPKQVLQRSVKKSVVEKIDGAWCAKWSGKVLRRLEGVEGDLGYSGVVGVGVGR